jgi:hypothetical protein
MDFQLRQQLEENARLKQELEIAKRAIKTSDACATLIKNVTETADPFLGSWDEVANPNRWKGAPPGGKCKCIVM